MFLLGATNAAVGVNTVGGAMELRLPLHADVRKITDRRVTTTTGAALPDNASAVDHPGGAYDLHVRRRERRVRMHAYMRFFFLFVIMFYIHTHSLTLTHTHSHTLTHTLTHTHTHTVSSLVSHFSLDCCGGGGGVRAECGRERERRVCVHACVRLDFFFCVMFYTHTLTHSHTYTHTHSFLPRQSLLP